MAPTISTINPAVGTVGPMRKIQVPNWLSSRNVCRYFRMRMNTS